MGMKNKKKRVHIIIISICLIAYFLNIEGREGRESLQGLVSLSPNHIPVAEERKENKKTPNIYASRLKDDHIISPGDLLNLETRGESSPCLPEYFPSRTTKLISPSLPPPSLIHSFIHSSIHLARLFAFLVVGDL